MDLLRLACVCFLAQCVSSLMSGAAGAGPWSVVPVARGAPVVFHWHKQRTGTGDRKFVWEAEKGDFEQFGPCGTDVIVRRRLFKWKGSRAAGAWVEDAARVFLPRFMVSESGRNDGAMRLRVDIGDARWNAPGCGRYYLHLVAAWCFHRARYGSALDYWPEFADDSYWQGDHLVDGSMIATPELVLAGHVELVPAHINQWRNRCAAAARAAMAEAEAMEAAAKAEAEAFARLRAKPKAKAKPKARRLADLPCRRGRGEPQAARVVGLADKGSAMRLEFDISWGHALACARGLEKEKDGAGDDIDPGRNPCAGCLFVEMESQALGLPANAPEWRRARASLLAYCLVKQHRLFFGDAVSED